MVLCNIVFPCRDTFLIFFSSSNHPWQHQVESFSNDCFKEELMSLGWVSHSSLAKNILPGCGHNPMRKIHHNDNPAMPQPFQYLNMVDVYKFTLRDLSALQSSYDTGKKHTNSATMRRGIARQVDCMLRRLMEYSPASIVSYGFAASKSGLSPQCS